MQEQHVDKPTTGHDYFERMCRVMLVSGLNWRTLEKKWPGIRPDCDHS
jgi:3-methyladenine DNA glycosylase Tag